MNASILKSLAQVPDDELLARTRTLVSHERVATAALIAHLAELEERRLHIKEGFSSLFLYCTQVLHLSESAAFNRIVAARTARRFPDLLDWIATGSVHLSAIRLLSAHMTDENYLTLLDSARHRNKRQVEEIVASIDPRPDVRAAIRRLPARSVRPVPPVSDSAETARSTPPVSDPVGGHSVDLTSA